MNIKSNVVVAIVVLASSAAMLSSATASATASGGKSYALENDDVDEASRLLFGDIFGDFSFSSSRPSSSGRVNGRLLRPCKCSDSRRNPVFNQCQREPRSGQPFCYVGKRACRDGVLSERYRGEYWSEKACRKGRRQSHHGGRDEDWRFKADSDKSRGGNKMRASLLRKIEHCLCRCSDYAWTDSRGRLKGRCSTENLINGRASCYVEQSVAIPNGRQTRFACPDTRLSNKRPGQYWSYWACQSDASPNAAASVHLDDKLCKRAMRKYQRQFGGLEAALAPRHS